jgi:DDE superfamily endonuclease
MTPHALKKLDRELTAFIADMTTDMGRPERRAAMGHYITGLLLDGERKSVQPMAARLVDDPSQADAMRQRLADCVTSSPWSDSELQRRLALKFARELPGLEVFVIDDTGFPKKGHLSVGVARSTRARSAASITAKSLPACMSQERKAADASGCACTCPKLGLTTARAVTRQEFRARSRSRRSGRSLWSFSTKRLLGGCRRCLCLLMPDTERAPSFAMSW